MTDHCDEIDCCPLCMEELDITDQTFNACPCGYQVCLWCWHQIKNEYNGLCPACRQPYAELSKQKNPLDREEVVRRTKQRKQKEKNERRSAAQTKQSSGNRKSLQNVRVMQRNLVYVIGLPVPFAEEDVLRSNECFGQYGKIVKAVVNKSHLSADRANATASAYITFANKEDALCCIVAIDGYYLDGSMLRASFGTTKYCNFFLRNMQCNNPDCLYLHELGDEDDSFTKEEMQTALHSGKAAFRDTATANGLAEERAGSRFPSPHRPSESSSRAGMVARARSSSPARASTLARLHNEEVYGDTQRHAQSAAAISKLRQATGDFENSSGSSSADHVCGAATYNTKCPPLARENSYSKIVAGGQSSSHIDVAALDPVPNKKPQLWVDISREEDTTRAVDAVVSPLEALKLATGSSTEQPVWAQPFPTPSASQHESEWHATTSSSASAGVYSPFGLGFDGGIHCTGSAREIGTKSPAPSDVWGSSSTMDNALNSFPSAPSSMTASTNSSSSFASIDAIFSHRNDSSEALAGLLGVQLAPNSLAHGAPLAGPPDDGHASRFSFANPVDVGRDGTKQAPARYELLDGTTTNNHGAVGRIDTSRAASNLLVSAGYSSMTDRTGFPPFQGYQQQLRHTPPPLHPSRASSGDDMCNSELPLSGTRALGVDSNGLAFLQQMLPNVNISLGGDYSGLPGPFSGAVGSAVSPAHTSNAARSSPGRRLFARSQCAGNNLVSPDLWEGGSLSALGFDEQSRSRRATTGPSFCDPALVPPPSSELSSSFYGFSSSNSNAGESECLLMRGDFDNDAYRRSSSLIDNS
uniref:RING-type domain-containing protein n=1 Tax=Hyaloperonospora arabidopsidis (strain Emoy2) TaxID=559515 RepID=M4B544_HYAAE